MKIILPQSGFRFSLTPETAHGESVWDAEVEAGDGDYEIYDQVFFADIVQTLQEVL